MHEPPAKHASKAFDAADPRYRWRLWVRYYSGSRHRKTYHFFGRRLAVVLGVLGLAGWFGGAAALWGAVTYRRGVTEARYVDVALPWRWHRYLASLASHYVAVGSADLAAGDVSSAVYAFSAALALAPGDVSARQLAAVAQSRSGQSAAALQTLEAGLAAAFQARDEAYFQEFFRLALATEANADAARWGRSVLPVQPSQERLPVFIAFQTATALAQLKRDGEALALLAEWKLQSQWQAQVLVAQMDWDQGNRGAALTRLQSCLERLPEKDGVYAALERFEREMNHPVAVLRYATLRQLADPVHAQPRLDVLYAEQALDRGSQVTQDVAAFQQEFRTNREALFSLGEFGTASGRREVVQSTRDLAVAQGADSLVFAIGLVEADLVARDDATAGRDLAALAQIKRPANRSIDALTGGLNCAVLFGAHAPEAPGAFQAWLTDAAALRPADGIFVLRQLRSLNRSGEAAALRTVLVKSYPSSRLIAAEPDPASAEGAPAIKPTPDGSGGAPPHPGAPPLQNTKP